MPVFCKYVNNCQGGGPTSGSVPIGSVVAYTGPGPFPLFVDGATWNICDGHNNTVDLRNRFIYGNDAVANPGLTGGSATYTLQPTDIPSHTHTVPASAVPITINDFIVPAQTIASAPLTGASLTGATASGTTDEPDNDCNHRHGPPPEAPYATYGGNPPTFHGGINNPQTTPSIASSSQTGNAISPSSLATHKHKFTVAVSGTITGGTVSGATKPGAALHITASPTGTTAQPTTGTFPEQTTSPLPLPPFMKLYYIERTA
jgi:hypothetical protein